MRVLRRLVSVISLLCALAAFASGPAVQDNPKILMVVTEVESPGRLAPLLLRLKLAPSLGVQWTAGNIITGNRGQAALFELPNYAAAERLDRRLRSDWLALPAQQRPALQCRIYEYAPQQSYNNGHVPWREARAFSLYLVELNAGGTDDYREQQRLAAEYLAKAGVREEEWLGYALRFGTQTPANLFVTPMRGIEDLDLPPEQHGQVLPDEVDRERSKVLLRAIHAASLDIMVLRPDLSSMQEPPLR